MSALFVFIFVLQ